MCIWNLLLNFNSGGKEHVPLNPFSDGTVIKCAARSSPNHHTFNHQSQTTLPLLHWLDLCQIPVRKKEDIPIWVHSRLKFQVRSGQRDYNRRYERITIYSVDSIKRTVHLAFHELFFFLIYSIFNRVFLKLLLKTVRLIEKVRLIEQYA